MKAFNILGGLILLISISASQANATDEDYFPFPWFSDNSQVAHHPTQSSLQVRTKT